MDDGALTQTYGNLDLPEGTPDRPLVTFALFAYNQERYIREAVKGAFSQTYSPLEIILSDDCSSDRTFEIICEMARGYRGENRVVVRQSQPNLGLAGHVNRVMALSRGEIIVVAAGDDISLPDRVTYSVSTFARHLNATAVSFCDIRIDEEGHQISESAVSKTDTPVTLDMFLAAGPRAQSRLHLSGASRAFRRKVWDRFGPLQLDCPAEDTPLLRRALYLGTCIRCGRPGIQYRVHAAQMSTPQNIAAMKAGAFRAQYLTDLALVGVTTRVRSHVEAEAIEFALRALRQTGRPPSLRLIAQVLPAAGFDLREKLGLLKRFFLREELK